MRIEEGEMNSSVRIAWNVINVILPISSLLGPWTTPVSDLWPFNTDSLAGWQVLRNYLISIVDFPTEYGRDVWWLFGLLLLVSIGIISLPVTGLISAIQLTPVSDYFPNQIASFFIMSSYLILGYLIVNLLNPQTGLPQWGFWIALIGIISTTIYKFLLR
jgi:hypothetical protein